MSAAIASMEQFFVEQQPLHHITIKQPTPTTMDGKMQNLWKIFESVSEQINKARTQKFQSIFFL
jgi:hypothetical protein